MLPEATQLSRCSAEGAGRTACTISSALACFCRFTTGVLIGPSAKGGRLGVGHMRDDLRIARMLQRTRPVQSFISVSTRAEFFFQAQVLFAGFR